MPTAIYKLKNGQRVPSVTGIEGIGKDSGGLIHWAWNEGMHGRDYRASRDAEAHAGEIGHIVCEAAIKRTTPEFPTDGAREIGMKAYEAYKRWEQQCGIRWTDAELSLVSEKYQFGGTIDAIGVEHGQNSYTIADFKTGSLYPEHLGQVSAYAHLFEECTGHPVRSVHLIRFHKQSGDFTHMTFGGEAMEYAWETFLLKRELFDRIKKMKKYL